MSYAQLFNYIVEDEKVIIESAAAKNITDLVIPVIFWYSCFEISNDAFSEAIEKSNYT